jgi:hypothetical protein
MSHKKAQIDGPQKGTKGTEDFFLLFCAFCASLWLKIDERFGR